MAAAEAEAEAEAEAAAAGRRAIPGGIPGDAVLLRLRWAGPAMVESACWSKLESDGTLAMVVFVGGGGPPIGCHR